MPFPSLKRLPRRQPLGWISAATFILDHIEAHPSTRDGILEITCDDLARELGQRPESLSAWLTSLKSRGYVLCSSEGVALMSRLSDSLKQEVDRNRLRAKRGSASEPDWSLRQRVHDLFPDQRGRAKRSANYCIPEAFRPLLLEHPHHHLRERPSDVELLTAACYPGELTTVLTLIAEQQSAHRTVHLLYTRKALYVGVQRSAKR